AHALERARAVAAGYANLEYDLAAGARGSRHDHLGGLLAELTGADTGMAVNNNAAAVILSLAALASGQEVIISRGELSEIGVGFTGDKLLGGPQAGVIVGTCAAVERIRRHPLARAVSIDKLLLAALQATLELYRDPQRALCEVPVLAAAAEAPEAVRGRAER